MIFFLLASIALTFGLLGFLLHAFYFGKANLLESLDKDLDGLREVLKQKEEEARKAQQEVAAARSLVQSLNQQLSDRGEDLAALRRTTLRQQQEIEVLRKTAAELRTALDEARKRPAIFEQTGFTQIPKGNDHGDTPLWKDNLNNLLSMLDKMETDK